MKECSLCHLCFDDHHVRCPSDDRPLAASIVGSTLIGNRYVLEKRLGRGGMGIVFKAKHQFLKNSYAIKIILPNLVEEDSNLVTRFRQEAVLAASIEHPNVIRVTDFGVEHETMPYLVMEFIDGVPLSSWFLQERRFTPEKVYEVFLPIALGIGEAHRKGIIHRDLKPQNIMIQKGLPLRQAIKVYDFGLAKIKSTDSLGSFVQAQTMSILGSPPYMSPEQWENKDVDHRADIYALGVIIYQMLTGELPFQGDSIPTVMYQHLAMQPPSFASLGVSLSPRIEAVVQKTLQKQKTQRYDSVEEMLREFENAMLASDIPVTVGSHQTEKFPLSAPEQTNLPPTVSSFPEDSLSDSQKERLKTYLDIPTGDELLADKKLAQKFLHAQNRVEEAQERSSEADKLIQELAEAQKAAEEAQKKALEAKQKVEADVRRRLELEMEQKLAVEQKAWQEAEAVRLAKEAESRRQAEERANYLAQAALEAQQLAESERKKAEQAAQQREYEENVRRQAEMKAIELAREIEVEKKKYEEARIEAEREAYLRLEAESKRRKIENDLELIAQKEAELRKIAEAEVQKQIQEQAERYEKEALAAQQRITAARELAEQEARKREEAEAAKQLAEKQALQLAQEINEVQKRIEEIKMQVSQQPNRAEQPPPDAQSPVESRDQRQNPPARTETGSNLNFEPSPDSNLTSANIAEKALHDSGFGMTEPFLEVQTQPQNVGTLPGLFDTQPKPPRKPPYPIIAAGVSLLFLAILGIASLFYFFSGKPEPAMSANTNTPGIKANSSSSSSSSAVQPPEAKSEPTPWIAGNRLKNKMAGVNGGTFQMGRSDVKPTDDPYGFQYPAHTVTVGSYYLDKTEVTNEEYWQFTQATGYPVPTTWKNGKFSDGEAQHPVTRVSQIDAMEFAKWVSEQEKIPCRLPTEEEWEFAARNGTQQTDFPWGNDWKPDNANLTTGKIAAVGISAGDQSLIGGFKDLMGNVIEWTSSPFDLYPNHPEKLKETEKLFVVRGSYGDETQDLSKYAKWQTTRRRKFPRDYKAVFTGFRLVCTP